jgi:LmbE family N-acetylglucosaminyl deacetylase
MTDILVVAAHPDDEVLGCGGTIAWHVARGDRVHVVIMAEGITSRTGDAHGGAALTALHAAAQRVHDTLGVASLRLEGLPDNRLDTLARLDVITRIEANIAQRRPAVVYTHHVGDVNVDHQVVHHAVVTACRPQPGHPVRTLLFFETPSSTEWQPPGSGTPFQPDWFVDIGAMLPRKLEALRGYASEMREWPHPRSYAAVEHLARWRGACSGVEAAEAFVLGRRIIVP